MANDGIRLPSDSTVATQAVRRGSEQAGQLPILPDVKAPMPTPSPLATVVLQSKALVEGKQAGLFQLLLQNDPKSNPPIELLSDTQFKPGTSLLIERDEQGQYRPVERVSPEQLQRLVKLELEFWQMQLLPKAQKSESIVIPKVAQLLELATQKPELKPLLNWIMPRTSIELTPTAMQQWVKAFTPLANFVAWPADSPNSGSRLSLPAIQSLTTRTETTVTADKPSQTNLTLVTRAINISLPIQHAVLPTESTKTPAKTAIVNPEVTNRVESRAARPIVDLTGVQLTPIDATHVPRYAPVTAATVPTPPLATMEPKALSNLNTNSAKASADTPTIGLQPEPPLAPKKNTPIEFMPPLIQQRAQAQSTDLIERRLADWLMRSEQNIRQDMPTLQAQLKQRAQQLLYSSELIQSKIKHGLLQNTVKATASETEPPLLAVRHWLDSSLAKVQLMAVQNALQQWTQPDQPIVQQAQIPLIWLGLSGWVDIEWWAQKHQQKQRANAEKHKRRWTLRLFFSIEPMADICADIDWGSEYTKVVFWSNDQATLAHLNQLLPTLKAWTQGLSDDSLLETKRGFPKRTREQTPTASQHLVDVMT